MKRLFCSLMLCVMALGLRAHVSENSTIVTIGTTGPDTYADGTAVLDGECYALVWRASNRVFAGFTAEGKVAEPAYARALCLAPLAKDGKCPETTFVVDSGVLAACGDGGTFGLYLLDTRKWLANGSVVVGGATSVHGSVLLRTASVVSGFQAGKTVASTAFLESALPTDGRGGSPTIAGIRVEDESIVLTVTGTAASLNYNVAGGASVGAAEVAAAAERPVAGDAQPIELRVPRSAFGDRAFFRVVRNPLEVTK